VRARWRQFRRNAGFLDILKTVVVVPGFALIALRAFDGFELFLALLTILTSFCAPYLVRGFLTDHVVAFGRVSNALSIPILLAIFFFEDSFRRDPRLLYAFIAAIVVYVGSFFWVFSDPLIHVTRPSKRSAARDSASWQTRNYEK
jgi:hypothetical protein